MLAAVIGNLAAAFTFTALTVIIVKESRHA